MTWNKLAFEGLVGGKHTLINLAKWAAEGQRHKYHTLDMGRVSLLKI